jgi:uncharacterized membrane protein
MTEPPTTSPTRVQSASGCALFDGMVAIENDARLDQYVDRLAAFVAPRLGRGTTRDLLGGRWMGHSLHPLMTDLPIGFWTSATVLDWLGGRRAAPMARRLVGLGVLSALPTVVTGLSDWSGASRPAQRVGVVHAATTCVAVGAFTWSWVERRRGHGIRGRLLALAGGGVATVGGHFGGHLAIARGVGVRSTVDVLDDVDGEVSAA